MPELNRTLSLARNATAAFCLCALLILAPLSNVSGSQATDEQQACLKAFLETGADSLTLGEMRQRCAVREEDSPQKRIERRIAADREAAAQPYSLLAHKPNYILFGAWNEAGYDSSLFQQADNNPNYSLDDVEAQFQLSFKVPLAINLWGDRADIYAAYTNRSFWQVYNMAESQPFRETNHEPELWVQFRNDWSFWGVTNVLNSVGYVHQSNGQGNALSRGWDRIYANLLFEKYGMVVSVKPWVILNDDADSDNPDIGDYMGHGEIRASFEKRDNVFSLMLRNQLESGFERGSLELSWSFPVFDYPYLKGYLQYFNGYGESLIDYDRRVNSLGIGISVTDWLD